LEIVVAKSLIACIHAFMHSCIHAFMGSAMAATASTSATKQKAPGIQAPSRVGKKGVTFYLKPDAMKQLRGVGLDEDNTLQGLMIEATNMLFKSRGKAEIAT
jgi:hypothetical protein